jgi:hypothetical protein
LMPSGVTMRSHTWAMGASTVLRRSMIVEPMPINLGDCRLGLVATSVRRDEELEC